MKVEMEESATIFTIKQHAEKEWNIPADNQKVIFMGKILSDKLRVTEANRHKLQNPMFTVVKTVKSRENSPKRSKSIENTDPNRAQILAGEKIVMCYTLLANIKAGNDAFENGLAPQERERVNEPRGMVCENTKKPTAKDLGIFHQKMAEEMNRYNRNIVITSDLLVEDPELEGEQEKFEEMRRKIQLTMDMGRYISPMMKINSGFIIPLKHKPTRFISYRENPIKQGPGENQ